MGLEVIWFLVVTVLVAIMCLRCCCYLRDSRQEQQPEPPDPPPTEEVVQLTAHRPGGQRHSQTHPQHHPQHRPQHQPQHHPQHQPQHQPQHHPQHGPASNGRRRDTAPSAPPAGDLPPSYSEAMLQAGGVHSWTQQDTMPPAAASAGSAGDPGTSAAPTAAQEIGRTDGEPHGPVTWS